jgi:hypothetical protein
MRESSRVLSLGCLTMLPQMFVMSPQTSYSLMFYSVHRLVMQPFQRSEDCLALVAAFLIARLSIGQVAQISPPLYEHEFDTYMVYWPVSQET